MAKTKCIYHFVIFFSRFKFDQKINLLLNFNEFMIILNFGSSMMIFTRDFKRVYIDKISNFDSIDVRTFTCGAKWDFLGSLRRLANWIF